MSKRSIALGLGLGLAHAAGVARSKRSIALGLGLASLMLRVWR